MTQQFQAPAALTENPGWVPSTMSDEAQPPVTPALGDLMPSSRLCAYLHPCVHTYRQAHMHTFKNKKEFIEKKKHKTPASSWGASRVP